MKISIFKRPEENPRTHGRERVVVASTRTRTLAEVCDRDQIDRTIDALRAELERSTGGEVRQP